MLTFKTKRLYWAPLGLILLVTLGKELTFPAVKAAIGLPLDMLTIGLGVYTLAYLIRRFRQEGGFFQRDSRFFLAFMGVMAFWFVYGCAAIFVSPYTTLYEGIQQMYYLAMGGCTVFCTYECCSSLRRTECLVKLLAWICAGLIFFCLAESFAGFHMKGSLYVDPGTWYNGTRNVPAGLYAATMFLSSGFDYSCNDVAARIGILLPALFVTGKEPFWEKAVRIALVVLGLYVMILNDSNVVIVAVLFSLLVYGILCAPARKASAVTLVSCVAFFTGISARLTQGLLALKAHFWTRSDVLPDTPALISGTLFYDTSLTNAGTSQVSQGSLFERVNICLDALDITRSTRFLGAGPAGYGWFDSHSHRSGYVNPHCWYLEVLSQYGIVVFIGYFASLVTMFFRMIGAYRKNHRPVYAVVVAMCAAFVFACVAPSTFMGYTYAWCLPGLCLALLRTDLPVE